MSSFGALFEASLWFWAAAACATMVAVWEAEWQEIDLSHVHGFPIWVREVHDLLVTLAHSTLAAAALA